MAYFLNSHRAWRVYSEFSQYMKNGIQIEFFFNYWPCSNCYILVRCIWLWLRSWLAVGADSFFYKVSGQSLAWQCGFLLWFTEGLNSSLEFLRCTICLSASLGFPACSALFKLFPVCGSTHSFIVMPKPLCGHAAFSVGSLFSPVSGKKNGFWSLLHLLWTTMILPMWDQVSWFLGLWIHMRKTEQLA